MFSFLNPAFFPLYPICVALWVVVLAIHLLSRDRIKKWEVAILVIAGGINVYLAPAFFRTLIERFYT